MIGGAGGPGAAVRGAGRLGLAAQLDECLETGILVRRRRGLRFRHELVRMAVEAGDRAAPAGPSCTPGCWPRWSSAATPTRPLLAHHAEGAGDDAGRPRGTPRRRPGGPRRWARTARRRPSSSGRCGSPADADRRDAGGPARGPGRRSTRCSTGGRRPSRRCAPRWRCAASSATSWPSARTCGGCPRTLWRLCRGRGIRPGRRRGGARSSRPLPPGPELAWAYANLGAPLTGRGAAGRGRRGRSARPGSSASSWASRRS